MNQKRLIAGKFINNKKAIEKLGNKVFQSPFLYKLILNFCNIFLYLLLILPIFLILLSIKYDEFTLPYYSAIVDESYRSLDLGDSFEKLNKLHNLSLLHFHH